MKKSILMSFVFAATITATLLSGCGKDSASSFKADNFVGTYYGAFTLTRLAFSTPALDTVIGKELIDTLTISENGSTTDNIVTAFSKVLNTTLDVTLTSETAGDLAITNKSLSFGTITATAVAADGKANYNTTTRTLTLSAKATNGTVLGITGLLGIAKPEFSGTFIKQ